MSDTLLGTRTIHLPATSADAPVAPVKKRHSGLRITDLQVGETARITHIAIPDTACRKRFAELGLAEGMKVTIASTGDTLMLIMGSGNASRMGVAARCADVIHVVRV